MKQRKLWRVSELQKVSDKFEQVFDVRFSKFYPPQMALLSAFSGQILIDIVAFDDYLHKKFGQYEDSDKSMEDVIKEHYGKDAAKFFETLI